MQITRKKRLFSYAIVIALFVAAATVLTKYSEIQTATRWFAASHRYKTEVLAQPAQPNGEFRHIEWDVWGWGGQDATVYLVFDPADSLSAAANSHSSGKFGGIPCEVFGVRRLQANWYTVRFYTNEFWGRANALNCGGSAR